VSATVPLWLLSLYEQFAWYYIFGIFAGECLLAYCAGFLSNFIILPFSGTTKCKQCGATMMFCGRHFNPAGSPKPDRSDIVICAIFIGLNVVLWVFLATGNFYKILVLPK